MNQTINGTIFETKIVPVKSNQVTGHRVDHFVDGKRVSRDAWYAILNEEKDKAFEAR